MHHLRLLTVLVFLAAALVVSAIFDRPFADTVREAIVLDWITDHLGPLVGLKVEKSEDGNSATGVAPGTLHGIDPETIQRLRQPAFKIGDGALGPLTSERANPKLSSDFLGNLHAGEQQADQPRENSPN